jgi:cytochrome c
MDDRNNTIAGWVLFAGIVGLGAWVVSGEVFRVHAPEKAGWQLAGADEGEGGGEAAQPIEFYLATADAAKGADVFKKCTACHTINQGGANGLGPNLYGVMGKAHGVHPGFAFSDALKAVPGVWDWKAMDEWLTSPRKYAPGTKMTFAGLGNPQDRANLLMYLNANGSNLPVPPPPAAAPAAEGEADGNAVEAATGNEAAPAATEAPPANAADTAQ